MSTRGNRGGPPGRIHIIGGTLRRSRLSVPVLPGLRPTPQRVRQTLFDWLAPVIAGAKVLDAFAGTGALGIEALSRGAAAATFFESDRGQAQALAADLARLRQAGGTVRCVDALAALANPSVRPRNRVDVHRAHGALPQRPLPGGSDPWPRCPAIDAFDVVFVDPPFGARLWEPVAGLLDANGWLAEGARIYVEAGAAEPWRVPARWQVHRQLTAGAVRGTLFRVAEPG